MTNTINRAELAPILYALQHGLGHTIATDSACSLRQIERYIHDPSSMERHLHRPILQLIVEAIVDRARQERPVHLIKVAAHSGIVGNEHADELAKLAGSGGGEEQQVETCPASADTPMHDLFWPLYDEVTEDGRAQTRHVQGLGKHLKRKVHQEQRLGLAKQDGIYFQAWQGIIPCTHASSNGFMSSNKLPAGARKLVLQARCGTLCTGSFRYKCKLATSPACLLCGGMDGGHHSLSGCSHMLKMYTKRHNEAGGILYRTLAKGGLGAALVMQDIGRHNAVGKDEGAEARAEIGTRLPPELADLVKDGERVSRPDILVAHRLDMPHLAEIHIVEIKYCRDTDRAAKQQAGASQHEVLASRLRQTYPGRVHVHVITLGVAGTIYSDMIEALTTMQVGKREALRCAGKLHAHAATYVHNIMHTKWSQEHQHPHKDAG